MTARQILIKCLDENTDVTCRKSPCDRPEKEGNTGKCCHKCSLEILKEYENKIYNKAIQDFYDKVINFEDYIEPCDIDGGALLYVGAEITEMIFKIKKELDRKKNW